MDILHLESVGVLVHWLNKKSLPQVTELTHESSKLLEMLNQNVLVGVTSLNHEEEFIRRNSKELVEKTLPGIAPTLFRAMNVAWVDFENAPSFLKNELGLKHHQMPVIYIN